VLLVVYVFWIHIRRSCLVVSGLSFCVWGVCCCTMVVASHELGGVGVSLGWNLRQVEFVLVCIVHLWWGYYASTCGVVL